MGLDMYLKARMSLSNFGIVDTEKDKSKFKALVDSLNVADVIAPDSPIVNVEFTIGYWRKANAIHKWFVDNVQDGVDECEPHPVSINQLLELRDLCKRVLKDTRTAPELLPPQAGFFFGSTEMNESYLDDLRQTIEIIDRCLNPKLIDYHFVYRSSW